MFAPQQAARAAQQDAAALVTVSGAAAKAAVADASSMKVAIAKTRFISISPLGHWFVGR
jgi:hypothetical protein